MRSVFLRLPGVIRWCVIPEPQPPDVEAIQAMNPRGGERRPVVAANGVRQPVRAKQPPQRWLHAAPPHIEQTVAAEEVAAEVVNHSERVAVDTVPRAELAFEVDGPHLVGRGGPQCRSAGMLPPRPASPRPHTIVSRENVKIVLRAGQRRFGSRVCRRFQIFRAPQPYRVCSSRISVTTSAGVSVGDERGARLRSSSPGGPSCS